MILSALPVSQSSSTKTTYKGAVYINKYDEKTGRMTKELLKEMSIDEIEKLVNELQEVFESNYGLEEKITRSASLLEKYDITPDDFHIQQYIQYIKNIIDNKNTLDQVGAKIIVPSVNAMFSIGGPVVYAWPPRVFLIEPFEAYLMKIGDYNFTLYQDSYASLGMVMLGNGFLFSTNGVVTSTILNNGFIFICLGYIGMFLDFYVYTPYPNEKPRRIAEFMLSFSLGSVIIPY